MNHGNESSAVSTTTHPSQEFLDARAAADLLGVSYSYLAKLRMTLAGPIFRKFGRSVKYQRADLDQWADAQRRRSTFDNDTQVM